MAVKVDQTLVFVIYQDGFTVHWQPPVQIVGIWYGPARKSNVQRPTRYAAKPHLSVILLIGWDVLYLVYRIQQTFKSIITYGSKRPANFQQTSSISTCILNTFAGSLLDVCWIV